MVVEVDVEPFAACSPRRRGCGRYELGSDSLPTDLRGDHRVQDERMDTPVPHHVHETDKITIIPGADPTETVRVNLVLPIVVEDRMTERVGVERVYLCVDEVGAPFVGMRHDVSVASAKCMALALQPRSA